MQSVAVKAEVKYAAPALLLAYHLEAEGITKRYPGVVALDGVSLKKVRPGTVHALMGENGAGKSTLMKIIAGIARPDAGEIRVGGWPVHFHSPRDATDAGIAMIHQELNLVPHMTIAENIWMGREPTRFGLVNHGELNRRTRMLFTRLGIDLDPEQPLGSLTVASQQLVEIAKAVSYDSDVLITYAIGGNVLAARVSGINVGRHWCWSTRSPACYLAWEGSSRRLVPRADKPAWVCPMSLMRSPRRSSAAPACLAAGARPSTAFLAVW